MAILVIDATAEQCAAALIDGSEVLATQARPMATGHAEHLFPLIREMMGARPLSVIEAIAVCTGPGNFTGARIGVAAARGLALSLGVPAIGVDRFECASRPECCVVIPGRGEVVHAARYSGRELEQAATINRAELAAFCKGHSLEEVPQTDLCALAAVAATKLAAGTPPRPAPRYLRPVNAALPSEAPPPVLS